MCDNVMSEECQKSDNRCPTILPPPPFPKVKDEKKMTSIIKRIKFVMSVCAY